MSHRVDVEHVDSQVIGGQVERLKHLLERHLPVTRLRKKDFVTQRMRTCQLNLADGNVAVSLQSLLDEPQQVFLVHAGCGVNVSVHLGNSLV